MPPPAAPTPAAAAPAVAPSAQKEQRLFALLTELGRSADRVQVAYSGGVDSTYLLWAAHHVLGAQVLAVTADSPSLERATLDECVAFCAEHGIAHQVVRTDEFDKAAYVANDGLRCFECKAALLRAMHALAGQLAGNTPLLLGAIVEDFGDVRPGMQAAQQAGARWPLADAGFAKADVRERLRAHDLPQWNRPAQPCLSSRFPYGEPVTAEGLRMIEAAERIIKGLGLHDCRARHHRMGSGRHQGWLLRIEVADADIARVAAARATLVPQLKALGYHFVSLDLNGLHSGGFNRLLGQAAASQGGANHG